MMMMMMVEMGLIGQPAEEEDDAPPGNCDSAPSDDSLWFCRSAMRPCMALILCSYVSKSPIKPCAGG